MGRNLRAWLPLQVGWMDLVDLPRTFLASSPPGLPLRAVSFAQLPLVRFLLC